MAALFSLSRSLALSAVGAAGAVCAVACSSRMVGAGATTSTDASFDATRGASDSSLADAVVTDSVAESAAAHDAGILSSDGTIGDVRTGDGGAPDATSDGSSCVGLLTEPRDAQNSCSFGRAFVECQGSWCLSDNPTACGTSTGCTDECTSEEYGVACATVPIGFDGSLVQEPPADAGCRFAAANPGGGVYYWSFPERMQSAA
jgi:hypothetical protein